VLGVVEFFHREPQPLDPDLLGVVATVGVQLGQFVDRRRAEDELRASGDRFAALAATLQASLLPPHLPAIPGVDLAARYRPAAVGMEVGGDFYDLFPTRGAGWGVVIGDVCGKGAEAATMTALARYTVRAAAMQARRPRRVLGLLNEAVLRQDDAGPFITVAYASVRSGPDGVDLVLSLGGHPQPLLVSSDGSVEPVGRPGSLLGVLDGPSLYDQAVHLRPGDALVFYTDGVTEARGAGGMLGEDGLVEALAVAAAAGLDAGGLADAVLTAVEAFEGRAAQDDLAVLVLRVP
jgi:sigma-B regulation protein RsbU (phosphoserine phosphatase)